MALPHDDQELLSRILHFCRGELLEHPKAQEALKRLGVVEPQLLESLSVGFSTGTLSRMLPEDEAVLATAKTLGFLDGQGHDCFCAHLILPLRSPKGHLAGYGTIHSESGQETLTVFEPLGCLYPQEVQKNKRVCLTASALDALLLAQAGEKATLVAPAQGLRQHLSRLSEFSIREAILAFQDEPLANACAQALAIHGIEPLQFQIPAGRELRELLRAGVPLEELLKRTVPVTVEAAKPQVEISEEGLRFNWVDRSWRIRLVEPHRFDHLKVSAKLTKDRRWHLDTIDLGLAKQRQTFIHMAKKIVRMEPAALYQDLLTITEEVERYQADRLLAAKKADLALSEEAKQEAEEFLKEPALFDQLAEDFKVLGWVGDTRAALIGYLTLASRLLEQPMAVAWLEGTEPTGLADLLLPLLPDENLVYLTRPSPKALLYQEEEAMEHRLIAAETHTLSSETLSYLKKLIMGQTIRAQVVIRDPESGRLKTTAHSVKGPCSVFLTVSRQGRGAPGKLPGAPFLPLQGLEELPSKEQRSWVIRRANLGRLELKQQQARILAKHRAIHRLLKPYPVVASEALLSKEEDPIRCQRLTDLSMAIAFLRQRQKQTRFQKDEEYLEVDDQDVALASELCRALTDGGTPAPHGPSQQMLEVIRRRLKGIPKASFTRSQAQAWVGKGQSIVCKYLDRLEAEGYIKRLAGSNGRAFHYRLEPFPPASTDLEWKVPVAQGADSPRGSESGFHLPQLPHQNGDG